MGTKSGAKRRREPDSGVDTLEGIASKIGDTIMPVSQGPTGPTSFAGLIPTSATAPAPAPGKALARVKTFQDVSGTAAQAAAAAAAAPIIPLSQSDWLPPVMAPRPALASKPGEAVAPAPAIAAPTFSDTPLPPMDWSLKQTLRFTSNKPFAAYEELRSAPRLTHLGAERMFAAGPSFDPESCSPAELLAMSTLSWQFPQTPAPPAASRALGGGPPAALVARRRDWQEALCSLYDALCTDRCAAFYVVAPQLSPSGGKQGYTVLFRSAGLGGRGRPHAILSRATPGVRELLKQQGVAFEAPLMGSSASGASGRSAGSQDLSRSVLIFEGRLRVHALLDFLLNRAFSMADEICDVPVLMAPAHFTHGSVRKYHLSAIEIGGGGGGGTGGAGGKSAKKAAVATQYQLEVRNAGPGVPAWVADRMLCVLSSSGSKGASVSMACDPLPASVTLNWHFGEVESTKQAATGEKENLESNSEPQPGERVRAEKRARLGVLVGLGGCVSEEEAVRWASTTPGLDSCAVREVVSSSKSGKGSGKAALSYRITQATPRLLPLA